MLSSLFNLFQNATGNRLAFKSNNFYIDLIDIYNASSFSKSVSLMYNLVMDHLNAYDLILEQNLLNIPETYLIGIVLLFITIVLWCLLKYKTKRQEFFRQARYNLQLQNELQEFNKNQQTSKQQKHSAHGSINGAPYNEQDGHMSDSAISFFNNFGDYNRPRFRKRDKLFFYGKKMLRTVSTVRGSISARSAEKSKKIYKIISKK
jgi:hypothetical protein